MVDGLIKLMNTNYNLPVNIGNNVEMTVNDIADIILKLTIVILIKYTKIFRQMIQKKMS